MAKQHHKESKLTIEIETDNAAFDADPVHEVRRILERLLNKMEPGQRSGKTMDHNGNTTGKWEWS